MFSNSTKAILTGIGVLISGCSPSPVATGIQPEKDGVDHNNDGFLALSESRLRPLHAQDSQLLSIAQNSAFSGATLPSGAVVPDGKGGLEWVTVGGDLVLKKFERGRKN